MDFNLNGISADKFWQKLTGQDGGPVSKQDLDKALAKTDFPLTQAGKDQLSDDFTTIAGADGRMSQGELNAYLVNGAGILSGGFQSHSEFYDTTKTPTQEVIVWDQMDANHKGQVSRADLDHIKPGTVLTDAGIQYLKDHWEEIAGADGKMSRSEWRNLRDKGVGTDGGFRDNGNFFKESVVSSPSSSTTDPSNSTSHSPSHKPDSPKPEHKPDSPKSESKPDSPKSESKPDAPKPEHKPDAPKSESKPDAPKPESKPDAPKPEHKPDAPKPEHKPDAPKPEHKPDAPKPEHKPDAPKPEHKPDAPKPEHKPDAPKPEHKPDPPPAAKPHHH